LPGDVYKKDYELEYGTASLEIQTITDIKPSDVVVIVDDLIATGGTAIACADIVHENFNVIKNNILVLAVIDLPDLGGFNKIHDHGYHTSALIEFEGE
jgi:adenine phosphoribosyltransferase